MPSALARYQGRTQQGDERPEARDGYPQLLVVRGAHILRGVVNSECGKIRMR
jgi:hypothetical protein